MHQKILNAAASYMNCHKKESAPRPKVAALCGVPKETKSYANSITVLKKKGFAIVDKETITVTEFGMKHADAVEPTESNKDSLEMAKKQLKLNKCKQILDLLSDGKTYTRVEIGAEIGADPTTKSFLNLLSPLKTPGYIDYVKKDGEKAIVMQDWMFPAGRPGAE